VQRFLNIKAMKSRRRPDIHRDLLREVINKHDPIFLPVLDRLGSIPLTDVQRERLRSSVAQELVESGLDENDEPTFRGFQLEELIDVLGRI
jgi:hypothetical protein